MIFTEFLESLYKPPMWKERSAQIEAWVSAGKLRDLRRVLTALADDEAAGKIDASVKDSVVYAIERGLCRMPGLANAELALEIAISSLGSAPQRPWLHPREALLRVASLLASDQPPEVLFALFRTPPENPNCREVLACLIQEMLVRRIDVTGPPAAFHAGLNRDGHPLGRLPLTLLRQEEILPTFFSSYVSGKPSFGDHSPPIDPVATLAEAVSIDWTPLAMSEDDLRMLRSAFDNWIGHSNGRVEGAAFMADRQIEGGDIAPDILQALPLKCLESDAPDVLHLYRLPPQNLFSELFLAAAHGAAYSPGYYSAYGRLDAWRTIRGFTGCDGDASLDDLSQEMDRCAWFAFSPVTPWFNRVAWDVGFLALRADKKTLVALAATDTD